jgi:hypothetical protein
MVAQYTEQPKWADGDTLEWSGGVHCNLPSLVFNGECQQSGTPTPDNPIPIYSFDGIVYVRGRDTYLYTPYLNGIGSYRDEWDYVTAKGVRRIKEIVLDGVTNKTTSATGSYAFIDLPEPCYSNGASYVLSTHFKSKYGIETGSIYIQDYTRAVIRKDFNDIPSNERINAWNAWLAEQYANGTPVTVYYAIAEPIPFEERSEYDVYEPIPNDSGHIDTIDSSIHPPFNITYITHS